MSDDDNVQLSEADASALVTLLGCLADLIDGAAGSAAARAALGAPEGEHDRVLLSEIQRRLLTNPPAHAITRDPGQFASSIRRQAAVIAEQLGPDAPDPFPT